MTDRMRRMVLTGCLLGGAALIFTACADDATTETTDTQQSSDTVATDMQAADTGPSDTMGPDTMGPDTMGPDTMGPDTMGPDTMGPDVPPVTSFTITLELEGLEALTAGAYEGWLIFGDEKVSTGTFTAVDRMTMTTDRDPAGADAFVVTIEPTPDADAGPSGVVVLVGDVSDDGRSATLAFPADLSTAAGGFILRAPTDDATNATHELTLTQTGLEDLSEGAYEGWLIFGDEKVSTGTFTTGAGGVFTTDRDPAGADAFVVTIEPTPDNDPGPSGIVVLSGAPAGATMSAELTFGADLSTAAGGFILRAPPDDATNMTPNDEAGLWFIEPTMDGMMAGLTLPTLPDGWVYEGWAVTQGMPLTSGRFTDPAAMDLGSPYSDGGPPFPGEDYLIDLPLGVTGPVNLADGASTIVISVEPDAAGVDPTGAGPFALKPLALPVPMNHPTATFTMLGVGPTVTVAGGLTWTSTPVDNDTAGVWFLEPAAGGMMPGLTLPMLPEGWVYEGWAVTQGMPLTTGRFTDPAAADMASPYSDGGPPFPGEDLLFDLPMGITPPVNLADGSSMLVISVEPDLAGTDPTGDGPFAIKPLAKPVPMDHPTATFTELGAGPVVTVSGTATFAAAP